MIIIQGALQSLTNWAFQHSCNSGKKEQEFPFLHKKIEGGGG